MNYKKIIFDTNVLLINPELLNRFSQRIFLPKTILDELDYRKTKREHQEQAQLALHHIERNNIRARQAASQGSQRNDERILTEALACCSNNQLLLVSNDVGMRNRAKGMGIESESLEAFLQSVTESSHRLTPERERMFRLLTEEDFEPVRLWIRQSSDNHFNFYLKDGYTPLIDCIRKKRFKALGFLLQQSSIDLDMRDQAKLKMTAFCHAAQRRQIKTMDQLIECGANPHLTAQGRNRGNSPLLIAAWDGALNVIRHICSHDKIAFSINQADNNGFTPLIKAAIKGHEPIVRYLLELEADVMIRDRDDRLAIDYAIENNHQSIVQLLKEV
ncbi:ankyrin repeat domain-containing protein [Endozoicomonas sp. 4G]|uniref:ankyrin repeat domain-containing protein n=1 Tax=Endozoicomonas sp. 4G TaxID=2872754 RepID=UPI0020788795|nr:ankyrin repeat domain-containing protein [Endozoicomonas sp. 4G]